MYATARFYFIRVYLPCSELIKLLILVGKWAKCGRNLPVLVRIFRIANIRRFKY